MELSDPHKISLLPHPQTVMENPVYKLEDLQGTSWKMTILNIRSLASLAIKINLIKTNNNLSKYNNGMIYMDKNTIFQSMEKTYKYM